jgi:hypothetical protein
VSPSAAIGASPSAAAPGSTDTAALTDACGGISPPASPALSPGPTAAIGASSSAGASGPPDASTTAAAIATDQITITWPPHAAPALEGLLPSAIGGISLCKFSMQLSTYIASATGGDKLLYSAWVVKSAKTPDDVDIAIAAGLTNQGNVVVQAVQIPGVDAATLTSRFADAAREAGWPVTSRTDLSKPVLVVTDQTAQAAGAVAVVYVYAKNDVLYVVNADDLSLLFEGLAALP